MGRRSKQEIEQNLEQVEEAQFEQEFTLADLEGIGEKKLAKLEALGITTPYHLAMASAQELAEQIDIDFETVSKMIEKARSMLESKNVVEKSILSGRELLDFRKGHVQRLTTGIPQLDKILGGGYESGVMTELFGQFGTFKTQFCTQAAIYAQFPKEACCLRCGQKDKLDTERCTLSKVSGEGNCNGGIWRGGGLSEYGNPCKVIYMDTENSFRPERFLQMLYETGAVLTKEQSKTEEKMGLPKEPLNEEEYERALKYLDNVIVFKVINSGHQVMLSRDIPKIIDQTGKKVKLVIVDSIISQFRKDFGGRGELSQRQLFLAKFIRLVSRAVELYNCVCIITNQVMQSPGAFGDPTKPVGGLFLGHTSKQRLYLQPKGKDKITAILVDSADQAKNEVVLTCTIKGIELSE
jgi:DNA repair protein RadA